jgi:hypothetical protein
MAKRDTGKKEEEEDSIKDPYSPDKKKAELHDDNSRQGLSLLNLGYTMCQNVACFSLYCPFSGSGG